MKRLSFAIASLVLLSACGTTPPPDATPPPAASSSVAIASPPPSASTDAPATSAITPPPSPPAPSASITELARAALKNAENAINAHDPNAYVELFTKNAVHKEAATQDLAGRREIAGRMSLLFRAFPDLRFSFDRAWQKDNIVVATWHWNGTDRGGFLGKRATQRAAGTTGVTVAFLNADGQVREVHFYEDGQQIVEELDPRAIKSSFRPPPSDVRGSPSLDIAIAKGDADEDKALATAKAFYAALEDKNATVFASLVTDDATLDDLALPSSFGTGKNGAAALLKSWSGAFGEFHELPLYNQIAIGNVVITERVLAGSYLGKPGVKLHALDIAEIKDGKVARFSAYSNTMELMVEVGPHAKRTK